MGYGGGGSWPNAYRLIVTLPSFIESRSMRRSISSRTDCNAHIPQGARDMREPCRICRRTGLQLKFANRRRFLEVGTSLIRASSLQCTTIGQIRDLKILQSQTAVSASCCMRAYRWYAELDVIPREQALSPPSLLQSKSGHSSEGSQSSSIGCFFSSSCGGLFCRVVGDFFRGNKLWGTKNEPHNWLWEKVVGDFFWNFSLELWETIWPSCGGRRINQSLNFETPQSVVPYRCSHIEFNTIFSVPV